MSKTAIDPDDELLGIAHPVPAVPTEYQDVQPDYGPCMSACLDKERRFTLAPRALLVMAMPMAAALRRRWRASRSA